MVRILHVCNKISFCAIIIFFSLIALTYVLASCYGRQTAKYVRGCIRKAFVFD